MISIIIPTYNRKVLLEKCLKSVFASTYRGFEVIVVDDSSTDRTDELAGKYQVTYCKLPENKGAAHARNFGAAKARQSLLLFIDSDVMIRKDTLANLVENYKKHPKLRLMCGYKLPVNLGRGWSSDFVMLRKTFSQGIWPKSLKYSENTFVETAFLSIKKGFFRQLGGFSEMYRASGGEEHELGARIRKTDKILFFRNLGVLHHFEPFWHYLKKLVPRSHAFGTIWLRTRKFEKGGFGTWDETINAALALVLAVSLALAVFLPAFIIAALAIAFALAVRRAKFYTLAAKRLGFRRFPVFFCADALLYLANAIGAILAVFGAFWAFLSYALGAAYDGLRIITSRTPPNIGLFPTARCNLKCRHCFYWKEIDNAANRNELTLDEYRKISTGLDTLYYLTITGGEPSLRKDVPQICELFYKNNHTRMVSYHTNAFFPDKVASQVEEILARCPKACVNVALSLDGPEKVHNFIRQNKESYQRVFQTFERIMALKTRYPLLEVQFSGVMSKYNKDSIGEVFRQIRGGLKLWYGNTLTRGDSRFPEAKDVSAKEYKRLYETKKGYGKTHYFSTPGFGFIRHRIATQIPHYVSRILREKRQVIACRAGRWSAVIYDTGEVYPCELLNKKMGSLRQEGYDMKRIMKKSKEIMKSIKNGECWCTHEGNMQVNLICNNSINRL